MIVLNVCMIEDEKMTITNRDKFLSAALQKLTFILQYEPAVGKKDLYEGNQF